MTAPSPNTTDEPKWVVALASGGGNCVRVAALDGGVLIGDTKNPGGPVQRLGRGEWRAFLDRVKDSAGGADLA